jgi:hypothetical protein
MLYNIDTRIVNSQKLTLLLPLPLPPLLLLLLLLLCLTSWAV